VNLDFIYKNNNTNFIITYSYGRALQQSALKFWSKNIKDIKGAQNIFNHRAKMNTLAAQGKWSGELENK
jgi:fructose-bisphosphate aldolase class I